MRKQNKINFLILESLFHLGGIEILLYNILQNLDKSRYNAVLCSLYQPGPMGEPFIKEGFKFYHDLIKNKYDIRALFKLMKIIKENNIDVIYLVTQPLTLFWGFLIGKLCKIPVVCLIGNTVDIGLHPKLNIYKLMLPFVDRVVAQANMQKIYWMKISRIPNRIISVIYNGINTEKYNVRVDRNEKLKSLGVDTSHKIIGIVGRLADLKGHDIFLKAARLVLKENKEVSFLIVGDGPEESRIETLANELDIHKKVFLLGFRNDLPELIRIFDIAVLSSRTEAFPMVLLEYMACAKPIVATRVGSISEILINGYNGLLIDSENPKQLAEKINFLLKNPDYADNLGKKGKKNVAEKFRIETTAAKTQELLEQLINK